MHTVAGKNFNGTVIQPNGNGDDKTPEGFAKPFVYGRVQIDLFCDQIQLSKRYIQRFFTATHDFLLSQ